MRSSAIHTDVVFSLGILHPPLLDCASQLCQPCKEGFFLALPATKTGTRERDVWLQLIHFFSSGFPPSCTELLCAPRFKHLHTIKVSAFRIKRILSYFASLPARFARLSRLPASDIIISAKRKYQTLEKCCTPRNSCILVSQPACCFYKHWTSCTQILKQVIGWACHDFPKPHGYSYVSTHALECF